MSGENELPPTIEVEIGVLRTCAAAVESLPEDARARALWWLCQQYAPELLSVRWRDQCP